jgi:isoaspartyl peptidase/L-asparaginase-like protein (Ntn-hydrolase superfamily)
MFKFNCEISAEKQDSHDTIGVICLDKNGHLCAGTSTSGWKYKHPGRVGDAPLVGSGLYCDGSVGAAVATGDGEEVSNSVIFISSNSSTYYFPI